MRRHESRFWTSWSSQTRVEFDKRITWECYVWCLREWHYRDISTRGGGTKVTHLIQIKHLGFFVAANDSFSSLSHVEKERDPPCDSSVMFRKVLHIIHQRRRINLTFFFVCSDVSLTRTFRHDLVVSSGHVRLISDVWSAYFIASYQTAVCIP